MGLGRRMCSGLPLLCLPTIARSKIAHNVFTEVRKIQGSNENECLTLARCSIELGASSGMMTDLKSPLFYLILHLQAKLQSFSVAETNASSEDKYVTPPTAGYRHRPKLKHLQLRHPLALNELRLIFKHSRFIQNTDTHRKMTSLFDRQQ
jgi:hypothetical protein